MFEGTARGGPVSKLVERGRRIAVGAGEMPLEARALAGAGVTTWDAVDTASDDDLLALHGFGPRALRILRESHEGPTTT